MEIQKIFSDEYDEERLYSVLLDEEEMALFSDIYEQRNFVSYRKLAKAGKVEANQLTKILRKKNPDINAVIKYSGRLGNSNSIKTLKDIARSEKYIEGAANKMAGQYPKSTKLANKMVKRVQDPFFRESIEAAQKQAVIPTTREEALELSRKNLQNLKKTLSR